MQSPERQLFFKMINEELKKEAIGVREYSMDLGAGDKSPYNNLNVDSMEIIQQDQIELQFPKDDSPNTGKFNTSTINAAGDRSKIYA